MSLSRPDHGADFAPAPGHALQFGTTVPGIDPDAPFAPPKESLTTAFLMVIHSPGHDFGEGDVRWKHPALPGPREVL